MVEVSAKGPQEGCSTALAASGLCYAADVGSPLPCSIGVVRVVSWPLWQAGEYVKDEVVNFLVARVSNAPELHGYTARRFYSSSKEWRGPGPSAPAAPCPHCGNRRHDCTG